MAMSPPPSEATAGAYEALLTQGLSDALRSLHPSWSTQLCKLDPAEAADRLALHLAQVVEKVVAGLRSANRVEEGVALVSNLIQSAAQASDLPLRGEALDPSGRLLTFIAPRRMDGGDAETRRPNVPLVDTALMTNAPGEPRLSAQLISEMPSADAIDLLMAFIFRTGIGPMREALKQHLNTKRPVRVLTTLFTGSTELEALQELAEMGAQVRVSYDTTGTRLHAKAWIFHRRSGFSTGYVGSSNLSHSAQVSGLEWNLRVSAVRNRTVLDRMTALFETCWNSGDFLDFDPKVFQAEKQRLFRRNYLSAVLPSFEIRLEPFQERLLEQINIERVQGRHRNLLVAATGTGKTVMAAIDYKRLRHAQGPLRLLFIAHRREILAQARATFVHALRDATFGELWVDGQRPSTFNHVFASVQSFARIELSDLPPDHFDIVIIDEFHHSAAPTYQRLLEHLQPRELLGLTATPERADGAPVTQWFDHRIAAELRLWDAIDKQRLVPFTYYGIADSTDLRKVAWTRGQGYAVEELTAVFTANDLWAKRIIRELELKVGNISEVRALGFCVSVAHARFMARVFSEQGIRSVAVWADSSPNEREDALRQLADRRVNVVFSVDIFSEGVDVPSVDTLLMLRPTESPTVFMQQLGRGLRRSDHKAMCTVLDFVGHHRKEFSYDRRMRALLGGTRKQLIEQIEQGFPYLPSGCHMELEAVARHRVLQSLKDAIPSSVRGMVAVVRVMHQQGLPLTLANFIDHSGVDLEDVYASGRSFQDVLDAAGLNPHSDDRGPVETRLRRGIGRLVHIDDAEHIGFLKQGLALDQPPSLQGMPARDMRRWRMLLAVLMGSVEELHALGTHSNLKALWQHPGVLRELQELLECRSMAVSHLGQPLSARPSGPLRIHARYRRAEIQAAFGDVKDEEPEHHRVAVPTWREGVKDMKAERADVFLVTLSKTEKRFSPTTRYRDYAISPDLFHWESQSQTTADSPTGRRYQQHAAMGREVMLFIRQSSEDRAFHFAGPVRYLAHQGEMPMQITWRMEHPLPGDLYMGYVAAVA